MSAAAPTLAWFEGVCSQLEVYPGEATRVIAEFREQSYALEACHAWVQSAECSARAKFQLALVMQYSAMKNWSQLPLAMTQSLRDTLWKLIQNATKDASMPVFALNKILQVYALLWKRGWLDLGQEQQGVLLGQLNELFGTNGSSYNSQSCLTGLKLIISIVEEFESRSTSEIGLPLEFHMKTHAAFEQQGLNECYRLAQVCLSRGAEQLRRELSGQMNIEAAFAVVPLITESVKLCTELLSWTFDSVTGAGGSQNNLGKAGSNDKRNNTSSILILPRAWASVLLPEGFLENLSHLYILLRQVYLQLQGQSAGVVASTVFGANSTQLTQGHACMTELRVLLLSLSSLAGSEFYASNEERVHFGTRIFTTVTPLLTQAISEGNEAQRQGSKAYMITELCSQESVSFSSIMLRLMGTFKLNVCIQMSSFKDALEAVGLATFVLGKTMASQAQANTIAILNQQSPSSEDYLLESWQGDVLMHLLDMLCMVLDDPLFVDSEQSSSKSALDLRKTMREMSTQVFIQVFDCYLHTTLWEAVANEEEEEDDEEEGINSRTQDELLSAICTFGRIGISTSLDYVISIIQSNMVKFEALIASPGDYAAEPGTLEQQALCVQEILRVSSLFATHLLVEDFRGDVLALNGWDTPTIPQLLLEEAKYNPNETHAKVWGVFWQVMNIVTTQARLLSSADNAVRYHCLVSGYLLQYVLRFLREFFARYVLPDRSLYHQSFANSILFQALVDADFVNMMEHLFQASHVFVVQMPMEVEVISATSHMIASISKIPHSGWKQSLIGLNGTADLFRAVTATGALPCSLNLEGLSLMFGALSTLTVACQHEVCFTQLCTHVHNSMKELSCCKSKEEVRRVDMQSLFEKTISSLRGLARCPRGMDKILRQLFDYCLPIVTWTLSFYGGDADDVIAGVFSMLCDYAEHKLDALPQTSSLALYRTSLSTLEILSARIQTPLTATALGSKLALEEEEAWRSKNLLTALQLLNHLANKDFSLECEDDDVITNSASAVDGKSADQEVADVLIYGFQALIPTISDSLLRSYPLLCDRYFSFVAFVYNSYPDRLSAHLAVASPEVGSIFLETLIGHLLWACGAIEPTAARLALQAVQIMASNQLQLVQKGTGGIGLDLPSSTALFERVLDRLLEMIFFPDTVEYGIAWDRVDACGNALITLVALNPQRFMQTSNTIVQQLASKLPTVQQALFECFNKLTTDRSVDMTSIDRRNRRIFCENFRQFCQDIRPLCVK